ncbi:CshA/CshB family fibrillar adhesin-related protein [Bifidobacterium sp. ESL0798]|uniref:CshA/CshB family fibrillar adhesin-related protein n=1 Tax=Bifidobacterium sp. ESL0798 TaxID=2983235 RepID=UPI0023F7607F|nr:CshA/CshB family fibrillar adhesin-related protein [Bifidobacterium sp. ESL0798]WEV74023.1 CshA/CshB family fibrillar adhesin-related protein [Bifidobacterium sp. ESL0798]
MDGRRSLARLAGMVGALAVGLAGIVVSGTAVANPPSGHPSVGPQIIATGGNGRMLNAIDWVQWGNTDGDEITGDTIVWTTPSKIGDGHWISTRCAVTSPGGVSNALSGAKPLKAYKSGDWGGDGLSDMYNQGGTGHSNTMITGLANKDDAEKVTFDFDCATYLIDSASSPSLTPSTSVASYTNVPMQGLVFADAESNNWYDDGPARHQQEYIKAKPNTQISSAAPIWRLLDGYRSAGCSTNSVAELKNNTMRFRSDAPQCSNSGGVGPASVMFLQGSQSARVTLKGGGNTAVALGSIALTDFGDAPESYGVGSSLFQPQWNGGELGTDIVSTGTYTGDAIDPDLGDPAEGMEGAALFNLSQAKIDSATDSTKLANSDEPTPRLGAHEDTEADIHFSTNADGDDIRGDEVSGSIENDEDGVAHAVNTNVQINPTADGTFTQKVTCKSTADAEVKGWIDWDHDGHFDDATEGSNQQGCVADAGSSTGSSATLTWTVPGDAVPAVKGEATQTQSFERVRITDEKAPMSTSIMRLTPTGVTTGGEVEDYAVDVHVSMLKLQVNLPGGRHDPSDQFRMSAKDSTSTEVANATTAGPSTGIQIDHVGPKYLAHGSDYTISAPLAGGSASTESRYSTSLSCIDLAHGGTAVTVDSDGKFTMPADSNVQCTFKKLVRSNPTLKVITHITPGGTATLTDFPVTATPTPSGSATTMPDNVGVPLSEGSYKITTDMSSKPGYRVTSPLACRIGSTPVTVTDATVVLTNGDDVVCEQTVAPQTDATLTLKTQVERGDAQPGDFNFTVTPTSGGPATYTEGAPQVSAGDISTVTGSSKDGYEQDGNIVYYKDTDNTHSTPLTLSQAKTALSDGESVTGIRKVTTHRPRLTVKRERDYRYGGTAAGDGSRVKLTPQGSAERDVTLDQPEYVDDGTYSVRQLLNDGYRQESIKVELADGTPITINPDGTFQVPADADVIVTIRDVDKPGVLKWSRFDKDGTTLLRGSKWRLTGPGNQSLEVEDCTAVACTGADQDPTPGKFRVTGRQWGAWTISEIVAPAGHKLSEPVPLTLNPAEGENGLLKQTQFQNGKSSEPVLDPNPDPDPNPTPSPEQKPASTPKPASDPTSNSAPKSASDSASGPARDPALEQLPASGSDVTIVIVVAFISLTLAVPLVSVAFKQLRRREE